MSQIRHDPESNRVYTHEVTRKQAVNQGAGRHEEQAVRNADLLYVWVLDGFPKLQHLLFLVDFRRLVIFGGLFVCLRLGGRGCRIRTWFGAGSNRSAESIAALALRIRPDREFTQILQLDRLGQSGETYAIDKTGIMACSRPAPWRSSSSPSSLPASIARPRRRPSRPSTPSTPSTWANTASKKAGSRGDGRRL